MTTLEIPHRVIPCLDVHDGRVVKGQQFVDLRDAGDPVELAKRYEADGADELVFLDISATHERRRTVTELARRAAREIFVPFTVGGGIRSVEDAQAVLDSGADKIAVNSAALDRPELLREIAKQVGRQSVVVAIDAKQTEEGSWQTYRAGGRQATGHDAVRWARQAVEMGAGEILLTSIDQDGQNKGYDLELLKHISSAVTVPVIASGGAGSSKHCVDAIYEGGADAVLLASTLHRNHLTIRAIKDSFKKAGLARRPVSSASPSVVDQHMQKPSIAIIDHGLGNRVSVAAALEQVGAEVIITADPDEITAANGVVLPGVGAFPAAMKRLEQAELIEPLESVRLSNTPILGICLGHQLLFESSQEQEPTRGLGWLGGVVTQIETAISPNIGWRYVRIDRASSLTNGLPLKPLFYHAHEFAAHPTELQSVKGVSHLGKDARGYPADVVSIVKQRNIYGVQFHPEKSSIAGLRLLQNFVELCR